MKIVCVRVLHPKNPAIRFTEEEIQNHLNQIKELYSDIVIDKVTTRVVKADLRLPGYKTFREVIWKDLEGESILSIEYQSGLTYHQKESGKWLIGVDLIKRSNIIVKPIIKKRK